MSLGRDSSLKLDKICGVQVDETIRSSITDNQCMELILAQCNKSVPTLADSHQRRFTSGEWGILFLTLKRSIIFGAFPRFSVSTECRAEDMSQERGEKKKTYHYINHNITAQY